MPIHEKDPDGSGTNPERDETIQHMSPEILLGNLFQSFPDGYFLQTNEGKILSCNGALSELTGYTGEELCSMSANDLFADNMLMCITKNLIENRCPDRSFRMESMCTKKDGTVFPAELTVAFITSEDIPSACVLVRNISRERAYHEDIERLKNQLRHAQTMETIGYMVGGISHYFNNVFTGILGNLSLAEIEAPENLTPFIRHAVNAADRARGLARQLLSLSRTSHVVLEPTDIEAIIDDVETFARLTFDRRIEITVVKPQPLQGVLADAPSIHHILLNLCVNARDAIEEKHAHTPDMTEPRITIEAHNVTVPESHARIHPDARPGRYVRISVTDTGCGICEETKKLIFDPFFTTKEPGKGTGLGLATARETIKQHNGWIELTSEEGRGSTFTVFLPATSLKKHAAVSIKTADLPRGSETVLFVDDEEMVRGFGLMILERLGYKVFSASNGQEALDMFIREHSRIDLVILDLGLPVLSGKEFLEKIRLIDRDVNVIILSGHDFEHDSKVFSECRADDYILKPFTIFELAVSVRNVLDRASNR